MAGIYDRYAAGDDLVTYGSGKNQAAETRARLARAEWEDYKRRFRPLETDLFASLDQPVDTATAMAGVGNAFELARASAEQRQRLYGLQGTAEQQEAMGRSMQLAEATTKAGAANQAIQRKHDRDMAVMGGGLMGLTAQGG